MLTAPAPSPALEERNVVPGPADPTSQPPRRAAVRLRVAVHAEANRLDGGWWPRGADLAAELADLVDALPGELGPVTHALVPVGDWDPVPATVVTTAGVVEVASSPSRVPHLVRLTTASGIVLDLLVVPAWFTPGQGEEALLAAATAGNLHGAADLLREVVDQPEADPRDEWSRGSDSWWESTRDDPPSPGA